MALGQNVCRCPSALTGKCRHTPILTLTRNDGQTLGRPEENAGFLRHVLSNSLFPTPPLERNLLTTSTNRQPDISLFLLHPSRSLSSVEKGSDRLVELKPRKALGFQHGPPASSATGKLYLVDLFNSCLTLTYFPLKWKKDTVIVIPKPDKEASLAYILLTISLLSTMPKVSSISNRD